MFISFWEPFSLLEKLLLYGKNSKQKQAIFTYWVSEYVRIPSSLISSLTTVFTSLDSSHIALLLFIKHSKQSRPSPIAWVSPSWCYKLSLKVIWVSAQCHHIGRLSLPCLKYQLSIVLYALHCFLFLLSTYHHLISFLINPLSIVCFQKL